jgi:hypothetical protein
MNAESSLCWHDLGVSSRPPYAKIGSAPYDADLTRLGLRQLKRLPHYGQPGTDFIVRALDPPTGFDRVEAQGRLAEAAGWVEQGACVHQARPLRAKPRLCVLRRLSAALSAQGRRRLETERPFT